MRRRDASDWQVAPLQQADLNQHRRLVPVDVLVRKQVAFEMSDHDHRKLDAPMGRRDAGLEIIHAAGMRKSRHQLIDDRCPLRPSG